jgi:uncharacterized protein YlbG (UPF0298 family)
MKQEEFKMKQKELEQTLKDLQAVKHLKKETSQQKDLLKAQFTAQKQKVKEMEAAAAITATVAVAVAAVVE